MYAQNYREIIHKSAYTRKYFCLKIIVKINCLKNNLG